MTTKMMFFSRMEIDFDNAGSNNDATISCNSSLDECFLGFEEEEQSQDVNTLVAIQNLLISNHNDNIFALSVQNPSLYMQNTTPLAQFMLQHEIRPTPKSANSHLELAQGTTVNEHLIHVAADGVITCKQYHDVMESFTDVSNKKFGAVLVHFGKKRNGEVAIYVNHLSTYPKGSLQSTNFVVIIKLDPNVKDFFFEKFFIDAAKFNFDCANSASDSEFTCVGIDSGYVGIYVIQHLPFYKTLMFRWSTTVNITDFEKYSRMSLSQLGVRVFACLEELKFYEAGGSRPHYHKHNHRPMGGPVQMTENLKFIGKYALDEFTRKFDAKHLAIFVNPANSLLALPIDIAKFVVLERDVEAPQWSPFK